MRVNSEAEMLKFGEDFGKSLTFPVVIELIGDVGAGKTTFTRGLAQGLGISEPVTSPSFTISKRYSFPIIQNDTETSKSPSINSKNGELIHYDFYRLDDPGIMRDDLFDAMSFPNSVIVVEWGGGVADLLPETKYRLEISQLSADEREIQIFHGSENITDLWKTCGKLSNSSGKVVENNQKSCAKPVDKTQNTSLSSGDES